MLAMAAAACSAGAVKEVPVINTTTASNGASSPRSVLSGTRIEGVIHDSLSSRTNKVGDGRRAVVSTNVVDADGVVIIPAGSMVTLSIAELATGTDQPDAVGRLRLEVTAVTIRDRTYPVAADLETVSYHMQGRARVRAEAEGATMVALHYAVRDVVVSPGTPIAFTLTKSLQVSARQAPALPVSRSTNIARKKT